MGENGDGPRVAILAEYDALRGLGHGCGHNIIATAAVGAALALASQRSLLPGEIVFLGTPAEEDLAGKQVMLDDGLFEGVDAAMMVHASNMTHVEVAFLASVDAEVVFTGAQAHASSDPWEGRNALDALLLLFQSIGLWRQQLRPDVARPRDHHRRRAGGEHHPGPGRGSRSPPLCGPGLSRRDAGAVPGDGRCGGGGHPLRGPRSASSRGR